MKTIKGQIITATATGFPVLIPVSKAKETKKTEVKEIKGNVKQYA
ncbi:hypothetical protein [Flammeovirga sp. MY04]|nr:hypothetical protein [Flammeovirga sp. MY04]